MGVKLTVEVQKDPNSNSDLDSDLDGNLELRVNAGVSEECVET